MSTKMLLDTLKRSIKFCVTHKGCSEEEGVPVRDCPWHGLKDVSLTGFGASRHTRKCPWDLASHWLTKTYGNELARNDIRKVKNIDLEVWEELCIEGLVSKGYLDPLYADLLKAKELADDEKKK